MLVHLPGWGDFQLNQIESIIDPYPLNKHKQKSEEETPDMFQPDPVEQQSLDIFADVSIITINLTKILSSS